MIASESWASFANLPTEALKDALFSALQEICLAYQQGDPDDPAVLSSVPRLADLLSRRRDIADFDPILEYLARSVGLWNYIPEQNAEFPNQIIAEFAKIPKLDNIILHREQVTVLDALLSKRNVILSAPTSFGKSILIDAAIAYGIYNRVAIVVPTIALLDECRRRLVQRFGDVYDVLMHHTEVQSRNKVIHLGTQERLINRADLGRIDLLVVDEFYKLDPARRDERSVTLNAAVYQLLKKSRQFFFLGPNIESINISSDNRWRFEFLRTRFSTVAVDTVDLRRERNKADVLEKLIYDHTNWPALIFVSSPDKANELARTLAEKHKPVGKGKPLAAWIDEYFGGRWELGDAVSAGIGVHHGRIPRALASRFVRLFNSGNLPILICTSTLIEGVNTSAKSVFIYDKTINRQSYDFFTFSNIRGRAGRLGQHLVGKVFLFNSPPAEDETVVNSPLFADFSEAPDELVVHLEPDDATADVVERVEQISVLLGLQADELKRLSSLGIENLAKLRRIIGADENLSEELVWDGKPSYGEIEAVCRVICEVKPARHFGAASFRQLTLYIDKLRRINSMHGFFKWYSGSFNGDVQKLDNIFKFLRACEFSLPEYFSAVEVFVKMRNSNTDYSLFLAELPRWFRAEALKILEERGVPIQVAERFHHRQDTPAELSARIRALAEGGSQRMSHIERSWMIDALPQ